jgi:prolycopene isomerase
VSQTYDAVVIGSGIGGLTCGAFLARAGMRVCVLEQHHQIGGYAHSFKRKRFRFESAVHSVPMAEHGMVMHLLRLLGVDGMVRPVPQQEVFSVSMPGFAYSIPSVKDDIAGRLRHDFPHQKESLDRLFESMMEIHRALVEPVFSFEDKFVEEDREFAARYYSLSYKDFIDRHIDDEKLRYVFYSQWPYGGMSPDGAPTIFYTIMFLVHYLEGSHYCDGGFESIASALASAIESRGGTVVRRSRVAALRADNNRVRAAVVENGETYEARLFVSNVSPYLLHRTIVDESARNRMWLRRLGKLRPSVSTVAVYCGLKNPIAAYGRKSIMFWFKHRGFDEIYRRMVLGGAAENDHLILLRAGDEASDTLTLLSFVGGDLEEDWKAAKHRYAERILARAEELYPGTADAIELTEIGSPRTFERYTGNTEGALYGFENTRDIYGEAKLPIRTYLANLYQTGHWGKPGGGIWNVMTNGYTTAKLILHERG